MWWMLMIALNTGEYESHSVYANFEECVQARTQEHDICAPVEVKIIPIPDGNVTVERETVISF